MLAYTTVKTYKKGNVLCEFGGDLCKGKRLGIVGLMDPDGFCKVSHHHFLDWLKVRWANLMIILKLLAEETYHIKGGPLLNRGMWN